MALFDTFADFVLTPALDYAKRYRELLLSQFWRKPRIEGILAAILAEVQEVELMLNQLYRAFSLADAVGDQLDKLGSILQVRRDGMSDDVYRTRLRVEIAILASNGTPEDIIAVVVAAVSPGVPFTYSEDYPAAIVVEVLDAVPEFLPPELLSFLNRARDVGVRIWLIFSTTDPAHTFTYADGSTEEVDADRGYGDTTNPAVGGLYSGVYS